MDTCELASNPRKKRSDKEIGRFLRRLNFIRFGKKTVALSKDAPFLFEVGDLRKFCRGNKFFISPGIVKDYALLKKYGYIPPIKPEQKTEAPNAYLSLHVAHECNLACDYCFVKKGMPLSHIKLMSSATVKKAIDFFYRNNSSRKCKIYFVGGEPLLNMSAIKTAIEEIKKHPDRETQLKVLTNGTLLDKEKASFLSRNKVAIGVSYDAIRKENDRKRRFKNGGKTSRKILENIGVLRDMGIEVDSVKATIAEDSPYSLLDFAKSYKKIPIHPSRYRFSYEYSYPPRGLKKSAIPETEEYFDTILKRIKRGSKVWEEFPLNGNGQILFRLGFPMLQPPMVGCGFNKYRNLITPEGKFYFCELLVNKEEFYVGSLQEGVKQAHLARFQKIYRMDNEKCGKCWAKSVCVPGCPLVNVNKKALTERCEVNKLEIKKMIEAYVRFKPEDLRLLYKHSDLSKKKKAQVDEIIAVGCGIRNFLRQNTSELMPLNIWPYGR